MSPASIPPVAMAGISAYVCLYHFLTFRGRRHGRENLAFALLCLCTTFYTVTCAALYSATDLAHGIIWQRAQFTVIPLFIILFLWFVLEYTGRRPTVIAWGLIGFFIMAFVIQALDRSTLTWRPDVPFIKIVTLPMGVRITYFEAAFGPFTAVQSFMGLAASSYIFWLAASHARRGQARKARPLLLAMGAMWIATFNDTAVSNGWYPFIYIIEYGYMAVILLMTAAMTRAVVEAARTRDALEESEQRLKMLSEASFEGIALSENGRIIDCNDQLARIFGYTREEMLGRDALECVAPESWGIVEEAMTAGRLSPYEHVALRKDGSRFPVEVHARSIAMEGRILRVSVIRDITEIRRWGEEIRRLNSELEERVAARTAELETANRELEAFSYSVSHDLRAPLRAIDGFSRILAEDHLPNLPTEAGRLLGVIRESATQMGRLIDDLLNFSRLGRQPLSRQPVSQEDLVRQVLAGLEGELSGRTVDVSLGELPPCRGDPALLRIVWTNLLSNALKFTRRRRAAEILVGCRVSGDGQRVYYVKDNGAGFDMRYASRLFGVFQRLHKSEDYEGTGVGLANVQRIITRHGGRVWAESGLDAGATFFFTVEPPPA